MKFTINVHLMQRLRRVEHTAICLHGVQRVNFPLTFHGVGGTRYSKQHPYTINVVNIYYIQTQLSKTKRCDQYLLKCAATSADKYVDGLFTICAQLNQQYSYVKII
jgi:hypothetical protein